MAVLLSGGFSTQLENYVDEKEISGSPLWCCQYLASNPDVIVRTHQDYIKGECLENSTHIVNYLYAILSVYKRSEIFLTPSVQYFVCCLLVNFNTILYEGT